MRKWLVSALLLGWIVFPSPAGAQGGTKLESVNIELWSEFDEPGMLVIYEFIPSQETSLPADVTLRFPKDGNLVAVAVENNGELFIKNFTGPVEHGDWQTITIKADSYSPHRIEYYQPLKIEGNKRQFEYRWFGDYPVQQFIVTVLVPSDSTDLVTSPALENTTPVSDGAITSGTVTRNDLLMGHSFQFELEYKRTSTTLTKPDQPTAQAEVQPVSPVNEDTPGRVSIANLPWIIGGFGLALIGIALYSYWRSTQISDSQPRKRPRQKTAETEEGEAYCHECGTRAHAGDRFCRTCGSRLRVE
jgi:hypothetical protein